jgi:DNA-binding Xre family transcriptional regulator
MIRWHLADYLAAHDLNAHQLAQRSGLSLTTVYAITGSKVQRVDLKTLERILLTLRELTGDEVQVGDLLSLGSSQEPQRASPPWQALVGLLDHPAFDERSVASIEDDLARSLESGPLRR